MTSKSPTPTEGPLSKLAVPHRQLPSRLYVVLGPGHQLLFERQYNPNCNWDELRKQGIEPEYYKILGGLRSPCPDPLGCAWSTRSVVKIYGMMRKHFDPNTYTHQPLCSCFIPTFASYDDALYAAARFELGTGSIIHIDTSRLAFPEMKACHVVCPYDLDMQWPKDQFLFFHQIPLAALTHMTEILPELMRQRFPNFKALRALPIHDFHPTEAETPAPKPAHVPGRTEPSASASAPELVRKHKPYKCTRCGKARSKPMSMSSETRPRKRVRFSDEPEVIPISSRRKLPTPPTTRPIVNHRYGTRARCIVPEQHEAAPPPTQENGEGVSRRPTRQQKGKWKEVDTSTFVSAHISPVAEDSEQAAQGEEFSNITTSIEQPLQTNIEQPLQTNMAVDLSMDDPAPCPDCPLPSPRPTPFEEPRPITSSPINDTVMCPATMSQKRKRAEMEVEVEEEEEAPHRTFSFALRPSSGRLPTPVSRGTSCPPGAADNQQA